MSLKTRILIIQQRACHFNGNSVDTPPLPRPYFTVLPSIPLYLPPEKVLAIFEAIGDNSFQDSAGARAEGGTHTDVGMIAFDLDGTLLDDAKRLPEENLSALRGAADRGALLVPATGRIYSGIPEAIRALPSARYCITVNGAYVYDALEDAVLHRAELELPLALDILEYADTLPVLYDCYQDNWGYITSGMLPRIEAYVSNPGIMKLITTLRTPVESLSRYLGDKGEPVQKLQLYLGDMPSEGKAALMEDLSRRFPDTKVTSSMPFNIEINSAAASKGQALQALCGSLGIALSSVLAFGDGSNDTDMLRCAGTGVAMANAEPEVKAAAGYITLSNNESGVAAAIRHFARTEGAAL